MMKKQTQTMYVVQHFNQSGIAALFEHDWQANEYIRDSDSAYLLFSKRPKKVTVTIETED
jgi:hypothetical protein